MRLEQVSSGASVYPVVIQALRGEGEAVIALRSPGFAEETVRLTLVPSAVTVTPSSDAAAAPFERRATVATAPLDELTLVALSAQPVRAGLRVEVPLRAEGPDVRLSQASVVLTPQTPRAEISFTLPPAGQQGAIAAVAGDGFTTAPGSRLAVSRARPEFAAPDIRIPSFLARDTILRATVRAGTSTAPVEVTFASTDPTRMLVSLGPQDAPAESVRTTATGLVSVTLHGLAESDAAGLRIAASSGETLERRIELTPLVLLAPSSLSPPNSLTPGSTVTSTWSLYGSDAQLRPGASVPSFKIRSLHPEVATISPDTLRFGPGDPPAAVTVRAVAVGTARLEVESLGAAYPGRFQPSVAVVAADAGPVAAFAIGRQFEGRTGLPAGGPGFQNPGGAIVTVTSEDPERVLLARSASAPGGASVVVAVPPNQLRTSPVYIQGLATGQVMLRVSGDGVPETRVIVHVVPSWVMLETPRGDLTRGSEIALFAGLVTDTGGLTSASLEDVRLLAAAGIPRVRVVSSDPEVASVSPAEVELGGNTRIRVHPNRAGEALLRVEQPEGFGPAPEGLDGVPIRVVDPAISLQCTFGALGQDLQQSCPLATPPGVAVTAVSEDPARLLVSADASTAGSPRAALGASGLHVQGLASRGTAELVLSAQGFQDLRIPVILRPVRISLVGISGQSALNLTRGDTSDLTVAVNTNGGAEGAVLRPGADPVLVDVAVEPAGIVSVEPARIRIDPARRTGTVRVRALTPGAALLRLTSPAGLEVTTPPMPVSVR